MLITTIRPLSLGCRQTALLLLLCLVKSLAKRGRCCMLHEHHLGNFRTNAIYNAIYLQKVNFQQGSLLSPGVKVGITWTLSFFPLIPASILVNPGPNVTVQNGNGHFICHSSRTWRRAYVAFPHSTCCFNVPSPTGIFVHLNIVKLSLQYRVGFTGIKAMEFFTRTIVIVV